MSPSIYGDGFVKPDPRLLMFEHFGSMPDVTRLSRRPTPLGIFSSRNVS